MPPAGAFLGKMPVDVDQGPAIAVVAYDMLHLDSVEGGIGHGLRTLLSFWGGMVGCFVWHGDRAGAEGGYASSKTSGPHSMTFISGGPAAWLRRHLFRIWTAAAVLAAYGVAWVDRPDMLTWWKRTTTALIEDGCDLLPYPWGDRIETTLGNFGLWVQITLAIIAFRVVVWLIVVWLRWIWAGIARRRG